MLGFGVAGVAAASLIAEITAVRLGLVIIYLSKELQGVKWDKGQVLATAPLLKMLKMNRDLFIRTVCLLAVFGIFTAKGATMGDVTLAANAILFQLHLLLAYVLDGIANASSILVGRSVGAGDQPLYIRTIRFSALWAFTASVLLGAFLFINKGWVIALFTSIPEVQLAAGQFAEWVVLYPLVSFWGLQLNGIFAGATEAGTLRDSLVVSLSVFLIAIWLFLPLWGNHGLWFSFTLFSLSRSLVLWAYLPRLNRMLAPQNVAAEHNRSSA
ncbi:hypothetical protein HUR95_13205 [Caldalkalibacillus thermarum TA2.A1]|uniref:Probable multidrug resistance protein NorM n=1 Tax=Caldalkalibacillus thermarum (strain TA2.A1) TaxID=986075 RepID=A0A8X8I2P9_CALTT|nr:MATE family efflux transporter [Caldalkalibacillus thermarum]QZT33240.1 hypothetical protein HUR95_13205 [Caldalkalibacillus thermarum TA2.A1]